MVDLHKEDTQCLQELLLWECLLPCQECLLLEWHLQECTLLLVTDTHQVLLQLVFNQGIPVQPLTIRVKELHQWVTHQEDLILMEVHLMEDHMDITQDKVNLMLELILTVRSVMELLGIIIKTNPVAIVFAKNVEDQDGIKRRIRFARR